MLGSGSRLGRVSVDEVVCLRVDLEDLIRRCRLGVAESVETTVAVLVDLESVPSPVERVLQQLIRSALRADVARLDRAESNLDCDGFVADLALRGVVDVLVPVGAPLVQHVLERPDRTEVGPGYLPCVLGLVVVDLVVVDQLGSVVPVPLGWGPKRDEGDILHPGDCLSVFADVVHGLALRGLGHLHRLAGPDKVGLTLDVLIAQVDDVEVVDVDFGHCVYLYCEK